MAKKQKLTTSQSFRNKAVRVLATGTFVGFFFAGLFLLRSHFQVRPVTYLGSAEQFENDRNKEKKPCFVVFNLPYCFPCQALEEGLDNHEELKKYLRRNFRSYKIDARDEFSGGKHLAEKYAIKKFPTVILTDGEGNLLGEVPLQGLLSQNPQEFNALLEVHSMKKVAYLGGNQKDKLDKPKKEVGLLYRTASNWSEALELIDFLDKNWNEEIWLEPSPSKNIRIIIGRYSSVNKAKLTRKFLKLWEGEKTKLVALKTDKISYEN